MNYQIKGTKAREIAKIFEKIDQNIVLVTNMLNKLSFTLAVQKYPELVETNKSNDEIKQIAESAEDLVQRIVANLYLINQSKDKLEKGLVHSKTDKKVKDELKDLNNKYEELYSKLLTFDVDLYKQIDLEAESLSPKANKLNDENDGLENKALKIICEALDQDIESLSVQEMDELLANVQKQNIWGFDFFIKRLEAKQKAQTASLKTI